MKKYLFPLAMLVIFETVAVSLFFVRGNVFYLFNFSYIGVCLAVGLAMFSRGVKCARHFTQLAIGSYMLVYLGFVCKENMQIEGFWYYLRLGVFEAAAIHYAVAKIFGPLLFGRGWCGYACWTAMIFDLLPYIGNALYYAPSVIAWSGIMGIGAWLGGIAVWSCCPSVCSSSLLIYHHLSSLRPHIAAARCYRVSIVVPTPPQKIKCIKCGKCLKACPMDVEVNRESRKRQNATECILCYECVKVCPLGALH